ncbi:MAG: TonB-dependent receptor [Bacteroidaceae bacterium]|nr:TonB-dependent receptor [Bacteroidaceae bacterium]
MERNRFITTVALSAISFLTAVGQTINGVVKDAATGETIIGATVKYGDAKGVVTNFDGEFSINVNKLPVKLSITFTGYKKQDVTVYDDEEEIEVKLTENRNLMNDVVVVGYGTQSRTQLTGSVVSIKADVFENSTSATLDGALSGQVAGLNVTAASGQPGAESSIRIRGGNSVNASNEPLYVVDGFIYFKDESLNGTGLGAIESNLNPLATINPNDIESIEILKDVSATAIYGSRGANGVVLITTKKGTQGDKKAHVSYGYNIGASTITKKLDLLNASQWAQFQKDYFNNKGGYTDEQIASLGKGTDWQDAMLRTAIQQSHELSINGGTDKSRYAFSANYTDQDGIILNSNFQRYNFHTNLEWELQKGLKFGVNATYGRSKQEGLTTTEEQVFNSSPFSEGITNSFVYALLMPPVVSVYNADGSYNFNNPYEYGYLAISDHSSNPVYDVEESVAENINNYLLSNIWTTYKIGDFTFKAAVGLNSEKLTQNYFSGAYTSIGLLVKGIGGVGNRQSDSWQQEYTLTYNKDINDNHHVDAMVGYTKENTTSTFSSIKTNSFTNESLKHNNLGDGKEIHVPQTGRTDYELNSVIARVNYSLLNRYNATATFRADHSTRLAENHRWEYFPSLGISWNVDREAFLAKVNKIDYLKVRLTGGVVGNQNIPDYVYKTAYATGSYAGSSSYSKKTTSNDQLKWEKTASYNLGIDLGLFHGRLDFVLDAYYKKTYDLLLEVPMGFASGVTTQYQNVGNVENKGVEFAVNGTLLKRRRLTWTASANIAYNKNTITDMGKTDNVLMGSDNQTILRKGESLGSFYGLKFDGIVQSGEDVSKLPLVNGQTSKAGDLKYVDVNGDGKIDGNDRVVLGSIQPDFTYGFSTQLQVCDFDFSLSFAGSHGAELYNALGRRLELTGDSYNVLTTVLNSWTPENGGNTLALATNTRPFSYIDDRYVQSASYLKLRNVTIGYRPRLPKSVPFGIRVYATASNLFTISPYKGYDPEVSSGTDSGAYPSARTFTFGVNLTL